LPSAFSATHQRTTGPTFIGYAHSLLHRRPTTSAAATVIADVSVLTSATFSAVAVIGADSAAARVRSSNLQTNFFFRPRSGGGSFFQTADGGHLIRFGVQCKSSDSFRSEIVPSTWSEVRQVPPNPFKEDRNFAPQKIQIAVN